MAIRRIYTHDVGIKLLGIEVTLKSSSDDPNMGPAAEMLSHIITQHFSNLNKEMTEGERPDIDTYFMRAAFLAASRGTCARRRVGCVLVNRLNQQLSTGYNGVPRGFPHCRGAAHGSCPGANAPSGQSLDGCAATHAEQNAIMQCRNVEEIATAYVTASPCVTCTKLLLNTSCKRIVFQEEYPHGMAKDLWLQAGREWVQYGKLEEKQDATATPHSS